MALTTRGLGPTPSLATAGMGPLALIEVIVVTPGAATLTLSGHAPTVSVQQVAVIAHPGAGALVLTGYAPDVVITPTGPRIIVPGVGELVLTGFPPVVIIRSGKRAGIMHLRNEDDGHIRLEEV